MNIYSNLITLVIVTVLYSGCSSIFMPYKDEFKCNKGVGTGTCSSMSDNYKTISENNIKKTQSELNGNKDEMNKDKNDFSDNRSQKCEDIANAVWLKQRELEKKFENFSGESK